MLFTQLLFFAFFAILFVTYWSVQMRTARIAMLTMASFIFYGAWDYRFLVLLGGVIIIAYIAQHLLYSSENETRRNRVVLVSVVSLLSILAAFKYFNFFSDSFVVLFQSFGVDVSQPTIAIILPVGISFYIFQSIGYVVDVKRGAFGKRQTFLEVAFFIAFFPQLVAGPIVRAAEFIPQIDIKHKLRDLPVRGIAILFLGGFFKKAVIADNIAAMYVDPIFAAPWAYDSPTIFFGVIAYAVQIFCDFSGYSDMAIAVSRAFGFQLPINFRAPYFSSSITDFWRRWHISLSHWLRDYLYISLGGNRLGEFKTYRNLMLTMVLGGLWHGASLNFLFWGYLHGAILAIERLFNWDRVAQKNIFLTVLGVGITFVLTCIAWVFFRAGSFDASLFMIAGMFGFINVGELSVGIWDWSLLIGLAVLHFFIFKFALGKFVIKLPKPLFFAMLGVIVAILLGLLPTESQPFIYFQF